MTTSGGSQPSIFIRLYAGADGETLQILINDVASLRTLQELLFPLAIARACRIDLGRTPGVRMEGLDELLLIGGPEDLSPFRPGQAVRDPQRPGRILWTEPPDVWFDAISRIQMLVEEKTPGHQYLNPHDSGGVEVVVCFREYPAT